MKNNSGFSLVELIVVIAIMAILAGVAVPAYTKYIAKANDAKVMAELDAVKTAALGAAVSEGETLESITVSSEGVIAIVTSGSQTAGDTTADISSFYDGGTTLQVSLAKTSYESSGLKWDKTSQTWTKQ